MCLTFNIGKRVCPAPLLRMVMFAVLCAGFVGKFLSVSLFGIVSF